MKFLTDVNASGALANWLFQHGHDVARVADVDPGMRDALVLQWAWREDRIVVTTDQDFEEMVWWERKPHHGILRLENLPRNERLLLLEYVLEHHGRDLANGMIVIASNRKIRIRRPLHEG